ncbi:hypothetical protein Tco_1304474 [Tanacetum coccineum]
MKKLKENVHAIQVRCQIYEGPHLEKECPLNEETNQVEEAKYREFDHPALFNRNNRVKYHVGLSGYYTRTDNRPPYGEKRQSLEELMNTHMEESARRSKKTNEWITKLQERTPMKFLVHRVAKAIEEYEKTRADSNNTGGSGSTNTGGTVAPEVQGCSYKTFMNGKPHSFNGTEGVVGLKRWFEKMEQVFEICKCAEDDKQLKSRMAQDFGTLTLKGDDIEAYNNRFYELVLMCPELVSTEKKKIEKYIRGFPEGIKGNVTSSKPATLHDAINMARELIEQGVQAKALRIGDSNKRKWEDQQGNNYHQQQNRRQEAAKVYVAAPAKDRGYAGNLPWCNRCKAHHQPGPCPPRCGKCHKLGHQEGECRTRIPVAGGNSIQNVTCFGCGNLGHYRRKIMPECYRGRHRQDRDDHPNVTILLRPDFGGVTISKLDNLGRHMKKLKENVHAIQVRCQIYEGPHLEKECPLNEETNQVEEAKYREFDHPALFNGSNGAKYRVGLPGYYTRSDNQPPYGEKRPSNSVNVMPRSILEYLKLANLMNTNMLFEMADMTKKAPLGRPFLATIHAEINVFDKEISLGANNDRTIDEQTKMWPTCDPTKGMCDGRNKIYGVSKVRTLRFWYCNYDNERKNITGVGLSFPDYLLAKYRKYQTNSLIWDDTYVEWCNTSPTSGTPCQETKYLRPSDYTFREWTLLKVGHTDISEPVKIALLKLWLIGCFRDKSGIIKEPLARSFYDYKWVFDLEINQLADDYELKIGKKGYMLDKIWEYYEDVTFHI